MTTRNLYTSVVSDVLSALGQADKTKSGNMPGFMAERDGRRRDPRRNTIRSFGKHSPIRPDLWPPVVSSPHEQSGPQPRS